MLYDKLKEKYSDFFKEIGHLECQDGWGVIIESACSLIENHIKYSQDKPEFYFTQIKEKFGTLRLYYGGGNDYIDGIIRMAEAMSAHTCEDCGMPGTRRGNGWIRTLCESHYSEQERLKKYR